MLNPSTTKSDITQMSRCVSSLPSSLIQGHPKKCMLWMKAHNSSSLKRGPQWSQNQMFLQTKKGSLWENLCNPAKKARFDPKTNNTWYGYPAGSATKAGVSAIIALVPDSGSAVVGSNFEEFGLIYLSASKTPASASAIVLPVVTSNSAIQTAVPHQWAHCHSQYHMLLYNL